MQIDPSLQTNEDNYKILTNLVVPRPIAWVGIRPLVQGFILWVIVSSALLAVILEGILR
jgi:hypothetical protein